MNRTRRSREPLQDLLIRGTALAILVCGLSAQPGFCAFENPIGGARPLALGSAFLAVSDDINALQFNPAGLTQLSKSEILLSVSNGFLDLSDGSEIQKSYFAFGQPIRKWKLGTLGVGYSEFNLASSYKEEILYFSFARPFGKFLTGFTVKQYRRSLTSDAYTRQDPLFLQYGESISNFGLDIGMIHGIGERYAVAFTLKDFNQPDLGLAEQDTMPMEMGFGASYRGNWMNYSVDLIQWNDNLKASFGAEMRILGGFALRGGVNGGSDNFHRLSTGAGWRKAAFQIDYMISLPTSPVYNTYGIHNFSVILRF